MQKWVGNNLERKTLGTFGMEGERSDNGERFVSQFLRSKQSRCCIDYVSTQRNSDTNGQPNNQIDHVAIRSNYFPIARKNR